MSQDKCTIEVNGVELEARPGQMLIEVTDAAGIYVPRFCYHTKLSIAANCRMCLVEVENAPKPMPACATPVAPGMKVHTRSSKAIGAQKATMEFLLINHPLDCPICDQGGECELQDLAMGFGRGVSRFAERKRVVKDKNLGPLVSTDMTRCIHCTRCVRFTQEIAGFQELGTIGRGDRVEISPYIERSIGHELSGNIIDLCPVGALNSKPFRFSARAWEMSQHSLVSPHDCFGSRLFAHVMAGRIKRVVPQPCEEINETWLSDRDRFSYEGVYAPDRLSTPMIRDQHGWQPVDWDVALEAAVQGLAAVADIGALMSPSATIEEGYLLSQLMTHLGSANIDYRLRRTDFRSQSAEPAYLGLGMNLREVDNLGQILLVGSNLRAEVPLLAHCVRKAAMRGAGVHFVNPARYSYLFPVGNYLAGDARDFWLELATLLQVVSKRSVSLPPGVEALLARAPAPGPQHQALVQALGSTSRSAIFLGQISQRHPNLAEIEWLAAELARLTGSQLGYITEGANAAGLALAGVLPHRGVGGHTRALAGANAAEMVRKPLDGMILYGIEPWEDCAIEKGNQNPLGATRFLLALTPYLTEQIRSIAHVILPVATFGETDGTFVNVEGRWQSFSAAVQPVGNARPGWKVLRVLGNRLSVPGLGYQSAQAVRDDLHAHVGESRTFRIDMSRTWPEVHTQASLSLDDLDVNMYRVDAVVRRAISLQMARAELTEDSEHAGRRRA